MKNLIASVAVMATTLSANADGWSESKVSQEWANASGDIYYPERELITIVPQEIASPSSIMRVIDVIGGQAKVETEYLWFTIDEIPLAASQYTFLSEWGKDVDCSVKSSLMAGFIVRNGHRDNFLVAKIESQASGVDAQGNHYSIPLHYVLPIRGFDNTEQANAFMAELHISVENEGNSGISCFDPDWVGDNGQPCCNYLLAYSLARKGCMYAWWGQITNCIPIAIGAGVGAFVLCIQACQSPEPCYKLCAIGGGIVSAGSAILCLLNAEANYNSCIANARSQYFTNLANAGCGLYWALDDDGQILEEGAFAPSLEGQVVEGSHH